MPIYPLIQEMSLKGRRVFVRADFNVPIKDGEVADRKRIEAALPTIRFIQENGGRCILGSHLGRPDGKVNEKYSLEPVGRVLSELLNREIFLADDCIGDGPKALAHQLREGDVMLLQNLRFHPGEEANDSTFANQLASLCDVYINDAFGTLHRAHASTFGIAKICQEAALGLLVQHELKFLQPLREHPPRPFLLIMGGAKVSDKMALIERFLDKIDVIVVGGAMAYAFLKAAGIEIGNSLCDDQQVSLALRMTRSIQARNIKLILPTDHVIAQSITATESSVTPGTSIPIGMAAFDIGPKTVQSIKKALVGIETVFWNGPLGVFENSQFSSGTFETAKIIADSTAKKLAGGGDVASALAQSGCESRFDFVSTGGGATLEYLEGRDLPCLRVLELIDDGEET